MSIKTLCTAALLAAAATPAAAAPPRCDLILVEELRQECTQRAQRCEPLRTAAERDACYRGPRSTRGRTGDDDRR